MTTRRRFWAGHRSSWRRVVAASCLAVAALSAVAIDGHAQTTVPLTQGMVIDRSVTSDYTITVISDDGARLWIDGNVIIDAWDPHESRVDRAEITGGRKRLKLEYHEAAGWAEIGVQIQPRRSRK